MKEGVTECIVKMYSNKFFKSNLYLTSLDFYLILESDVNLFNNSSKQEEKEIRSAIKKIWNV